MLSERYSGEGVEESREMGTRAGEGKGITSEGNGLMENPTNEALEVSFPPTPQNSTGNWDLLLKWFWEKRLRLVGRASGQVY